MSPHASLHTAITEQEFQGIKTWIYQVAGINLSNQKRALVMGRLAQRLRHHQLASYGEYFELLRGSEHPGELQIAIDLLTTNETHFFREPKHFDYLREKILARHTPGRTFRVWSAASSSGEEPYSIAMTLAETLGEGSWEVLASDLSSRVLDRARNGHYAMARAKTIPRPLLQAYCLKGVGAQEGTFLIDPKLRQRVRFMQINLIAKLPELGELDLVFLRNVMIYFDMATKREVVTRIAPTLRSGGHMFVGHSESLNGVSDALKVVQPSIYRKP
ncbi:MAG: protein-glutamate O-methyltransferase CheR [Betaproteobacteria bacterium]|nr:protein-glutamate O-methyltransferase CheR [Betaproteobacteria bacterium]